MNQESLKTQQSPSHTKEYRLLGLCATLRGFQITDGSEQPGKQKAFIRPFKSKHITGMVSKHHSQNKNGKTNQQLNYTQHQQLPMVAKRLLQWDWK